MKREAYKKNYELEENYWWFVSRSFLVMKIAQKYLAAKKSKICDFGCGTGANLINLSKFGPAIGLDVSKEAIKYCKKRGTKAILLKNSKIPFKKNAFDFITALDVMEHVENEETALKELNRILKKDGVIVFTVPAFPFLWGAHDELLGHYRRYWRDDFKEKIQKAGFKVIKCSYIFAPYVLPLYLLRCFEKLKKKKELSVTLSAPNPILNKLFQYYMRAEIFLLDYLPIPFGTSVLCICTK